LPDRAGCLLLARRVTSSSGSAVGCDLRPWAALGDRCSPNSSAATPRTGPGSV